MSPNNPDSFRAHTSRALTAGGGKDIAERVLREGAQRSGMWTKDTAIRGYDIGGGRGMGEALTAHVAMGGTAVAFDQLEKFIRDRFDIIEKSKAAATRADEKRKPQEWPENVEWVSPWANVIDNFEDAFTDWVITQGANAATDSVVQKDAEPQQAVTYVSPVSEFLSDGINLFSFAKFGSSTWKIVRNWVSPTSTESVLRVVNVLPVFGAWVEKNVYSRVNHALERSKVAQFFGGWGMKSLLWYVLGLVNNEGIQASHPKPATEAS